MSIHNKIFGELEYNYDWIEYKNIEFYGKKLR